MSPSSSRFSFVLEIDGAEAERQAKQWAAKIEDALSRSGGSKELLAAPMANALTPIVAAARVAASGVEREMGTAADHLTQKLSRIPVSLDDEKFRQQIAEIDHMAAEMERVAQSTQRMGASPQEWLNMGQFERWSKAMQAGRASTAGLDTFGRGMQSTGRGMMAGAATALGGAALAGREYLQLAEPLGQAARAMELNAQLAEELDIKLRALAGTTSYFKPEEQAQGLYLWAAATGEVVQSSSQLDAALRRTESVQKLAKLGAVDFAQAVEVVTDIQSQYQKSVGETDDIVATLIKTAAVSKASVGDLSEAFQYVGGQAKASNVTFEETAATLNLLAAAGQRGSRAGMGLARLMENLIAPSDQAAGALDKVLGAGALEREGQFIGLANAIAVMADKTAEMSDVERQAFVAQITTQNAARMLIPLLNLQVRARQENVNAIRAQQKIEAGLVDEEVSRYQSLVKEVMGYEISVKSSAQTMADQWSQYTQSLDGQATLIEARWASAMETIGGSVTRAALPGIEKLVKGVSKLTSEAEAHPDLVSAALQGTAVVGAVGALVTALSKPVQIAADIKALLMARDMKVSADRNVLAATEMLTASRNMLQAAGLEVAAGRGSGAAAGGGAAAAGKSLPGKLAGGVAGAGAVMGELAIAAAPIAIPAAAIVALIALLQKAEAAHIDESAQVLESTQTYREYAAGLQAAGLEGYGLSEALYEIAKAQAESMDPSKQPDFLRGMQDAQRAATDYLGAIVHPSAKVFDVPWIDQVRADLEETLPTFDRYTLTVMANTAQVRQWAEAQGYGSQQAMELARAVSEISTRELGNLNYAEFEGRRWQELRATMQSYEDTAARAGAGVESLQVSTSALVTESAAVVREWRDFVAQITTAQGEMRDLAGWGEAVRDSVLQMHDVLGEAELGEILKSETASQWQNLTGLAGMMDPKAIGAWGDQYRTELASYLQGLNNTQQWFVDLAVADFNAGWDTRVQKVKDSSKEIEQTQRDARSRLDQIWSDWSGVVSGLLQPTQVTQEDMDLTAVGGYKPQWDEHVRRLRAAQTDMQSPFRKMLPTDVEQGGQGAINSWVEGQIRQFYQGGMLDAVNWDALVADYDSIVAEKMGKQNLLDRLMQKLIESGRTPDEYAAKTALGLESPIKQMWFGGMAPEAIGADIQLGMAQVAQGVGFTPDMMKPSATSFVSTLSSGIKGQFGEQGWNAALVLAFNTDITNGAGEIKKLGGLIGGFIFDGMRDEMRNWDLIDTIAQVVIEELAGAFDNQSN